VGHSELQHQGMAQVGMFQGQLDNEIMEGCKESATEIKCIWMEAEGIAT